MPRCSVCDLPSKAIVDRALIAGSPSVTALAKQHGVSRQAILRHRAAHIPAGLAESFALEGQDGALVAQLDALKLRVEALLSAAERKGDLRGAVTAVKEARGLVELIAKLKGELTPTPAVQVNLVQSPEFATVTARIMTALDPFPLARVAVVNALGAVN
jgi:hypothetical protein